MWPIRSLRICRFIIKVNAEAGQVMPRRYQQLSMLSHLKINRHRSWRMMAHVSSSISSILEGQTWMYQLASSFFQPPHLAATLLTLRAPVQELSEAQSAGTAVIYSLHIYCTCTCCFLGPRFPLPNLMPLALGTWSQETLQVLKFLFFWPARHTVSINDQSDGPY